MKKLNQLFSVILFSVCILITTKINSQSVANMPKIAVLNIDGNVGISPEQLGNITRTELSKLERFQVLDQYDAAYIFSKNDFEVEGCYGRICNVEAGKILKSEKMLTGSVNMQGNVVIVSFSLVDVATANIESQQVIEYVSIMDQVPLMIKLTLAKMFDKSVDQDVFDKLTKQDEFESSVNYPESPRLNLSGPRMGFTSFSGDLWNIYSSPKVEGGFDSYPLMFQFGYQFEVKYLNQGDFQALFEFIPVVTGLDQGKFIPSVSILNGLRSNKTGWEFAFGPILYAIKMADGYYDDNGTFVLASDWQDKYPDKPTPEVREDRIDSRGDISLDSGFLFGVGKTIKSGNLNIPINAFFIPGKSGHRFGISIGYNAQSYHKR